MELPVRLDHVFEAASINWTDARYGFKRGFLSWQSIVELAKLRASSPEEAQIDIFLLIDIEEATVWKMEGLLDNLAHNESAPSPRRKWMYIMAKTMFRRWHSQPEMLEASGAWLYGEFVDEEMRGPDEISRLFGSVPNECWDYDPRNDPESGLSNLALHWRRYLQQGSDEFKRQ